jgi:hypothetical protein
MKLSKSISILIATFSLITVFVASVLLARSTVAAKTPLTEPMGSVKPVKGIDVIVQKNPGNTAVRQTQSDAEGSFTVDSLPPGSYQVSLECKARCQSMNDLGAGSIQFTLTGAKESPFKRNLSKQELVTGVKFPIEIVGKTGNKGKVVGGINVTNGG